MAKDRNDAKDLIDWLGFRAYPNWIRARWLGGGVGFLLVVAIPILFLLAIGAAGNLLFRAMTSGGEGASLGTGALIAGLLGAPFVIWGTWLRHKTQRIEQEGHMTDRITKAVEQLGAEKTVKKHFTSSKGKKYFEKGDNAELDFAKPVIVEETVPNLEVRIGAILSLERIAQDSTILDNGRDHVRVMEILCAYIRENSNARQPVDYPEPEWEPLKDDATEEERAAHIEKREARFGPYPLARRWAETLKGPRSDVQLALTVIGRRSARQRRVEAAWPNTPSEDTVWPFDLDFPRLPDEPGDEALGEAELEVFKAGLQDWKDTLEFYSGYRLDLRGANLQRADMAANQPDGSDAVFSGAVLEGARLEGAKFSRAQMVGANLSQARLEGADLWEANLAGVDLWEAHMEGANLGRGRMVGAYLNPTRLEGAHLWGARLEGADLSGARMEAIDARLVRMEGAGLSSARIEGADLGEARLERAQLINARMDGAELRATWMQGAQCFQARMQGANLTAARVQGTQLQRAWMQGALLRLLRIDEITDFSDALLHGAALMNVDLTRMSITDEQLASAFGDANVILSETNARPAHWPDRKLPSKGDQNFTSEWHTWQADPQGYRPPEHPARSPET